MHTGHKNARQEVREMSVGEQQKLYRYQYIQLLAADECEDAEQAAAANHRLFILEEVCGFTQTDVIVLQAQATEEYARGLTERQLFAVVTLAHMPGPWH